MGDVRIAFDRPLDERQLDVLRRDDGELGRDRTGQIGPELVALDLEPEALVAGRQLVDHRPIAGGPGDVRATRHHLVHRREAVGRR